MTLSNFSSRGTFYGTKISLSGGSKSGHGLAYNLDFAKGKGLEQKLKNFYKIV